jgi:hypothetical protein
MLSLVLLTGCSTKDVITRINVAPPDFIKNNLVKVCDKPDLADTWMELTEHHHSLCGGRLNFGDSSCYGWFIRAKAKCTINGQRVTLDFEGLASGNTNIHGEDE